MVQYRIRFNPDNRLVRLPKVLAEAFGSEWTILPNTKAAVLFPEGMDPESVLRSLSIIQADLQLRVDDQKKVRK
jgi:hypothetical protein